MIYRRYNSAPLGIAHFQKKTKCNEEIKQLNRVEEATSVQISEHVLEFLNLPQ